MEIRQLLAQVVDGRHLSIAEAEAFLNSVMRGEVSEPVLASFLTAMRIKGELPDEIFGFVNAMRGHSVRPKHKFEFDFIDTCGTGGDGKGTINVSTLSAIVLASLGVKVAKHGNRSVSSHTGSSDILTALGYSSPETHEEAEKRLLETGFTFLFAPQWHPSMKYAAHVRKELGFRTLFNMVGPLSNPFFPAYQVLGVYSPDLVKPFAEVMQKLELKGAIVCHSTDGLDEFSIYSQTQYAYYDGHRIEMREFRPEVLKIGTPDTKDFYAEDPDHALEVAKSILAGDVNAGTYAVALNTGVALFVLKKVPGIEEGFQMALDALKTGKTDKFFQDLVSKAKGT